MNINYKNIILYLFLLSLVSCQTTLIQVSLLDSKEVSSDFIFQNEDIEIEYTFWQKGGSLNFTIQNKTNKPLFIDWEHSNFIFNGLSYDYFNSDESISSLNVYTQSYFKSGKSNGVSTSQSVIKKKKKKSQIPPNSYIQTDIVNLDFPWIKMKKPLKFKKDETPLNIRAYIGYSDNITLENLKYVDNEFWIKEIEQYKEKELYSKESYDSFYTTNKELHKKKTLGSAIVLAILVVLSFAF